MKRELSNRIAELEAVAPSWSPVDLPEIPADFTGTLIVSERAQIWIPDNGRGPADHPGPHVIRV